MGYVLCALTLLLKGQRRRFFCVKVGRRYSNGKVSGSIKEFGEGSSDAKEEVSASYYSINTLMTTFKSTG